MAAKRKYNVRGRESGGNKFLVEKACILIKNSLYGYKNCASVVQLMRLEKCPSKIRCKWENIISNIYFEMGGGGVELYL
jgi:hypothetical protein